MICPNCERVVQENEAHCKGCGLPLKRVCPMCLQLHDLTCKVCTRCHHRLPEFSIADQSKIDTYKLMRKLFKVFRIVSLISGLSSLAFIILGLNLYWWFSIFGLVVGSTAFSLGFIARRYGMAKFGSIFGAFTTALCVVGLVLRLTGVF